MGRPSKIESLEKKLNSLDPDVKKLFEDLLDAKTKDLKDENKEIKNFSVSQKKSGGHRFVPTNTKVKIRSNIDGVFIFSHNKGKVNVFLTIANYGDYVDLDYDEIKVINNSKGNYFRNGILVIEDVISEDEEITLEDVYYDLRLGKLYKNKFNPTNFEDLFGADVSYQVFEKYLLDNKEVAETVLIISTILYRQGRLNDNSKMEFFKRNFKNVNLYR